MLNRLVLVRHGETEWTKNGQHTGRTDVPLTDRGREDGERVAMALKSWNFVSVLSSPLSRAVETANLAGFHAQVETVDDLLEWDYGQYEGLTTADIRTKRPGWSIWLDGTPDGETLADVAVRVDRVLKEIHVARGDIVLFGHGHLLRVVTARWLGLVPASGRLFVLDPGTVSVLGYERETAVIHQWNCR